MSEAANVTGPGGKTVQGSKYAVDKSSNRSQKFERKIFNANNHTVSSNSRKEKLVQFISKLLLLRQSKINSKCNSRKTTVTIKNMIAS